MSLDVAALQESFALVAQQETALAPRFYEILFERYPQVKPLFRRSPEQQANMLTQALAAVVAHSDDTAWLVATLPPMGAKHVAYGVTEEMYDWVGECLICALDEICGAEMTPRVRGAWIEAYGAIAGLMKGGAASASDSSVPTQPSGSRKPAEPVANV